MIADSSSTRSNPVRNQDSAYLIVRIPAAYSEMSPFETGYTEPSHLRCFVADCFFVARALMSHRKTSLKEVVDMLYK